MRAFEEIRAIPDRERLVDYAFYFAALGEFDLRDRNRDVAREHFQEALAFARNPING
jgi:RNA polymerase sigma-70 factor (ECF subfamily)